MKLCKKGLHTFDETVAPYRCKPCYSQYQKEYSALHPRPYVPKLRGPRPKREAEPNIRNMAYPIGFRLESGELITDPARIKELVKPSIVQELKEKKGWRKLYED
jgi:hypothetical protein